MKKEKTSSKQSEKKAGGEGTKAEGPGKEMKDQEAEKKPGKEMKAQEAEKKPGFKVLVPLLSKREAESKFIDLVASKAKEIILLLVIDTNAMVGDFGFATSEIAVGNALMQKLKIELGKKRKTCNDIIEWGDTASKIEHMAQMHQVDKIYVVKQDNHFFQKLLQDMREKLKGIEIEAVGLPEFK